MEVTPFDVGELVGGADGLSGLAQRSPRSPGLHLTEVRDWLDAKFDYSGKGKRSRSGGGWPQEAFLYAGAFGFLWEDVIADATGRAMAARVIEGGVIPGLIRIGELSADGIVGSPDGYSPDSGGAIWEFKVAWRSVTTSPPEVHWPWMMQVKSYCYMAGLDTAHLVAFYPCGDWKPPRPWPPLGRTFRFTAEEVNENWRSVLSGAAAMQREQERE